MITSDLQACSDMDSLGTDGDWDVGAGIREDEVVVREEDPVFPVTWGASTAEGSG